jgi:hypothetical protein
MGMALDRSGRVVAGHHRGCLCGLFGGDTMSHHEEAPDDCSCTECQLRRLVDRMAQQEREEVDELRKVIMGLAEEVAKLREQLREMGK